MEDFCHGQLFWDESLTWTNNSWPEFTECFQYTSLTWIPCGFFFLICPLYVIKISGKPHRPQPVRRLLMGKVACTLVFAVLQLLDLANALDGSKNDQFDAKMLSSIIWIITMILHLILVLLQKSRNVKTSVFLFLFWCASWLSHVILFYTAFLQKPPLYESNMTLFAVQCMKFVIVSLCFLLNFSAQNYDEKELNYNPLEYASAISQATMFWINRLLIKGFKKPLEDEDVYKIVDENRSSRVIQQFLKNWNKDIDNTNRSPEKKVKDHSRQVNEKTPLLSASTSRKETTGDTLLRDTEEKTQHRSFLAVLSKTFWNELFYSQSPQIFYVSLNCMSPFILGWMMSFIEDKDEAVWHGYVFAVILAANKLLSVIFSQISQFLNNGLSIRVHNTAIALVFRKALTMSNEARKASTVGEIVNLMSVDARHLETMVNFSYWLWIGFLFLVAGIALVYTTIGIYMLTGLGLILILYIANVYMLQLMNTFQSREMTIKDERVKMMSEILNGMKVIKLYGWEPMFIRKILAIREDELKVMWKTAIVDMFNTVIWLTCEFWMIYLMLITFVEIDDKHYLDANTSFLTMNFVFLIMLGVMVMPIVVKDTTKGITSVRRMNKFLQTDDLDPKSLERDYKQYNAISIQNGDFAWERSLPPTLQSINLVIKPGTVVAVVGTVGSGKSSLISAVLGEMRCLKGKFNINSTVAYVPQLAWIQNASVRNNILFGKEYNQGLYRKVIDACALQPDLDIMPTGDKTEIGEKGINLSGGQKQRVSLARAVYSEANVVLLDDPLSAVDSHVGRHIFDHVIGRQGMLCNKTRLLVTHGVHWLPEVDNIVVMTDGKISETGTYEELISHNGAFAAFLKEYFTETQNEEKNEDETESDTEREIKANILKRLVSVTSDSDTDVATVNQLKRQLSREVSHDDDQTFTETRLKRTSESRSPKKSLSEKENSTLSEVPGVKIVSHGTEEETVDKSRLTTDEELSSGKVSWWVYWEILKGFGLKNSTWWLIFTAGYHSMMNFSNIWLAQWTDDRDLGNFTSFPSNSSERTDQNNYYLTIYTVIGVLETLSIIGCSIAIQSGHIMMSRKLHKEMLESVMRAPMSYFDTTPMGRILNRFSNDIEILDADITIELDTVMEHSLKSIATIIVIGYNLPIFLSIVAPLIGLVYLVQQFYIRSSCQLRRIGAKNRSPVYAHFSETLSGAAVIRAYRVQERFIEESQNKVDHFQRVYHMNFAVVRWVQVTLQTMCCVVILASCIFAVLLRSDLSPGVVGLIITYAIRVTTDLQIATREMGQLETHAVSVERIREYSKITSEAPWTLDSDSREVEESWPAEGRIEFVNYSTRYRSGLDLVLSGLTCSIKGGEKIGIVGRTGAGKSSLVLSVFRLIEAAGGQILIDGVDISRIGLHTLRRHITILPQDPILFSGSLRMNLDPFEERNEDELWRALEHAHLKQFVQDLPQKLDHEVGEGGENLSMGQRQLVCLARTLLRKTKILVLDEATAAVDMETDDLIQKTIRSEFSQCTILTIAHRLNTVLDYDRILVLQRGTLLEYDTPDNLLANPKSAFASMAKDAGITSQTKST